MDDDALVAALRDAAGRYEPVPPAVVATARDAFGLRDLDAELAALVDDGAEVSAEVAGVRSATAAARLLVSAVDDVEVELEVTEVGGRRSLVGQVHADADAADDGDGDVQVEVEVEVQTPSTTWAAPVDVHGRFAVDDVPAGPLRLRLRLGGSRTVVTAWSVV